MTNNLWKSDKPVTTAHLFCRLDRLGSGCVGLSKHFYSTGNLINKLAWEPSELNHPRNNFSKLQEYILVTFIQRWLKSWPSWLVGWNH